MAAVTTTIGRVYATPHSQNCWAYLNAIGAWRKIKPTSTDGHTNTNVALAAARATNATVSVDVDSANEIVNVYL
jgi:immune inhibitor A